MAADWQGPTIGALIAVGGIGVNNAFLFWHDAKRWKRKRDDDFNSHRVELFRQHLRVMNRLPFDLWEATVKNNHQASERIGSLIAYMQGDWQLFGSTRLQNANNDARAVIQDWIRESTTLAEANSRLPRSERQDVPDIYRNSFESIVQPKLKRLADVMKSELLGDG